MAGNYSIFKCVNFGNKFTALDESSLPKQEPLLLKMAKIWETNENLKKLGLHRDSQEMLERWLGAGLPNPYMFKISKSDLSIFQDHVNQTGKQMYEKGFGFNTAGINAKVLTAYMRWLPGGETLGREMEEILSFQRKHRETTQTNYNAVSKSTKALSELFGVDINKLAKLEDTYHKTQDPVKRNEILYGKDGIKELLGEMTSGKTNTSAGELLNGIRDIMEGTLIEELTYTNKTTGKIEPWTPEMKKQAVKMKNAYYSIRSDMLTVALSSLKKMKSNALRLDEIEGGRRGLYEFIDKIDSKIKELETTKDSPVAQEHRSKLTGLTGFGLEGDLYLQHRKGYSPHVVLNLMKVAGEFNEFMKSDNYVNTDGTLRTATTEFAETLDWLNKNGNYINNLKSRRDGQEEYYSRNPNFFLGKYVHDVSKMNHDVMTQDILQRTFASLLKTKDFVEGTAQQEQVDKTIHIAIENLKDIMVESDIISGSSNQSNKTKGMLARTFQSFGFLRVLAGMASNTVKNLAGAKLMNYMENGQNLIVTNKKYYEENPQSRDFVNRELDKHGYTWSSKDNFIQSLYDIWKNPEAAAKLMKIGGGASTRGTLEEGGFEAMGIKPKFNSKGQIEGYDLVDPNLLEKAVTTLEGITGASSVFQTVVENWVRPDVFRGTFATIFSNMQAMPEAQKLYMMGKTRDSYTNNKNEFKEVDFKRDFDNWSRRQAGTEAHAAVNATQFEYAKISKAPVMKGGVGGTVLQFLHYQFSYQNWLHNMFRDGKRSLKAAAKTGDVSRLSDPAMFKAYRYAMARSYAWMATMASGYGFTNWVMDPTYEWIKRHIKIMTADLSTPEGRKEFEQASFGLGASSNLGVTFSTIHGVADMMGYNFGSPNSRLFYKSPTPRDADHPFARKALNKLSIAAERLIYDDIPDLTYKGNAGRAFLRNTSLWMDKDNQAAYRGIWEPIEPIYKRIIGETDKNAGKYYKKDGPFYGKVYERDPKTNRRIKVKTPPEHGLSNNVYMDQNGYIKRSRHQMNPVNKIHKDANRGKNQSLLDKQQRINALSALDQLK